MVKILNIIGGFTAFFYALGFFTTAVFKLLGTEFPYRKTPDGFYFCFSVFNINRNIGIFRERGFCKDLLPIIFFNLAGIGFISMLIGFLYIYLISA